MIGATLEKAMEDNIVQTDGVVTATDFIGHRQTDSSDPQSFLVRAAGPHTIPGHFHAIDQFQIFVEGSAKIGRFDVRPGSLHYTDAYTTYGPIIASEEGYAYFTLRPGCTTSYHVMPGGGAVLKEARHSSPSKRRMIMGELDEPIVDKPGLATIFAEDDGVGAFRVTAEANTKIPLPEKLDHGGFIIMIEGHMTLDGQVYGPKSCVWAGAGETIAAATAGDEKLVAIVAAFGDTGN